MKRKFLAAAGVFLASCVFAADPTPVGEFTAMAQVDTPQGSRSMGVTVIVSHPMTVEQAQQLKTVLAQGGQGALAAAIRGGTRGIFRFGAMDYPIDLAVAQQTRDGFKYVVVTQRPLRYEEGQEGGPSLDYPFTVAIFEVRDFGSGDGQLFTKAALTVEEDGYVRVDQYLDRPGVLKDIKRR
jgi:hypothetical protein